MFDSPNNFFSKNWLNLIGVKNKHETESIDFGNESSNKDLKSDKKVNLDFGEETSNSNGDFLELGNGKKTKFDLKKSKTDFKEEKIASENKRKETQPRSISPNPKRLAERQYSTNATPSDRNTTRTTKQEMMTENKKNDSNGLHKKADFYRDKKILHPLLKNVKGQISLDNASVKGFRIFLMTWNLSGNSPNKFRTNFYKTASFILKKDADILYFGFQELFELKIKLKSVINLINIDECIKEWKGLFAEYFPEYKLQSDENLIGLQSFMLVKESLVSSLMSNETYPIKLGYMNMGNKGAIKLSVNFNGYNIDIYNCHLTAGDSQEKVIERMKDFKSIFQNSEENDLLNKTHCSFLLGDFNVKLQADKNQIMSVLEKGKDAYQVLKGIDEWSQTRKSIGALSEFYEEKISFNPTYKYVVGVDKIDHSRTPAWSDRVFFNPKKIANFDIIEYNSIPFYASDHTPVFLVADINKKEQVSGKNV